MMFADSFYRWPFDPTSYWFADKVTFVKLNVMLCCEYSVHLSVLWQDAQLLVVQ